VVEGPAGRDLVSRFRTCRHRSLSFYTSVDYILIEILISHPINVLQIFELLFHGNICYEY
jgi:hypothetical protein